VIDLLVKELTMLALLVAVGAGFARELRGRLDAGSQLALAPVFGFAASIALLTTVNFFVPLRYALWFALLPLAIASIGFAVWRGGIPDWRQHKRALVQLAVVLIGVLAILNAPLQRRDSAGPIAWGIYDAPGYVDCIAAFEAHTNSDPLLGVPPADWPSPVHDAEAWKPSWNLGARYCWAYKFQHQGGMTLPAAVSGGTGWWAWEMLSPYMALCVLLAALGSFALFRVLTNSRSWLAIAPALATAGAPLFQPYIDGSAGLLGGIALMPGLLAIGVIAFRRLSWRSTLLAGVLLAGLITSYPEMGAIVVGSLALALLVRLGLALHSGSQLRAALRRVVPHLLAAGVLAVALSPRATLWAIGNLSEAGTFANQVIDYQMQLPHLLGYLLQTREFYTFSLSSPQGFAYVVVGLLLPLCLIGVGLYGCVRRREGAWIVLLFVAVAAVQALYSSISLDCSYCVGRTLLTTVPPIAVLVTLGIYELTRSFQRWRLILGVALGTAAAIAAAASLFSIEQRAYRGAYMPTASLGTIAEQAEAQVDGTLELEGFGQTPLWSWGEGRTTYQAMGEATGERISVDSAYNEWGGLSYFNTHPPPHPSYTPDYEYVLTRLTALDTGRPVLAQSGTLVLQRRLKPFDATVARGVAVETYVRDPGGNVWVQRPGEEEGLKQGPLTFWVSALSPAPAFLRVELQGPAGLAPHEVPGAVARTTPAGRTLICMPVPGRGKLRIAEMPLRPLPAAVTYPGGIPFSTTLPDENAPIAAKEIQLLKDRVSGAPCAAQ
jgi:hypothetical protein